MDAEASMLDLLEKILLDEIADPTDLPISLLKMITNDFSDDLRIGSGGFAVVYKGLLQNGRAVAVKKLSNTIDMDETKYNQEVHCLMRVRHRNIVRFLGYCANTHGKMLDYEGKFVMADVRHRLLCFEYLPKGCLREYITDASCGLEWTKRYQIIKGICEGSHYLHELRIVHLDLKPANILLDHNMMPKISDFGLSKCFDEEQSQAITSKLFGSTGYVAPEFYGGVITFRSDIYSLGVIITEILTGRKGYSSVDIVLESWRKRLDRSLADTLLEQVRLCAEISIDCMDLDPDKRPVIQRIIQKLGKTESTDYNVFIESPMTTSLVVQNRRRRIFTNISNNQWGHMVFQHPMTFDTLAMDPAMKAAVMGVLDMFKNGRDYYARVGKPWRRTYLLYGPPGTGKLSLIAAMANYLDYDIYDIKLTSLHSNTDLWKLFMETTDKSIIVMEGVDCSPDLTGDDDDKEDDAAASTSNNAPLSSGVLDIVDGLWSACSGGGGEQLIVFTTSRVEKLDPSLIRRGRMDMHIEMSYCGFEAFKCLAKVYLSIESHQMFDAVRELLEEVRITPADVAASLTRKNADDDVHSCLARLVQLMEYMGEQADYEPQ